MERDFKGVWIPKEIWLNQELGWSEKLLLVEIDSLAKNGECFASNEYFAKFLGMSVRQIQNLIKSLKEKNLIEITNHYRPGTKFVEKRVISPHHEENFAPPRNLFREPHEENFVTPTKETSHHHEKNGGDINTVINTNINTVINTNKKEKEKEKIPTALFKEEFETLWKLYPRKEGKADAMRHYINARKKDKESYENVENGIKRYVEYLKSQGTDNRFILMGSSWFNQKKWMDEYTCIATQRKPKSAIEYLRMQSEEGKNEYRRNENIIEYYS